MVLCYCRYDSRDCDVDFYTGFPDAASFKLLLDHMLPVATKMFYWRGIKGELTSKKCWLKSFIIHIQVKIYL